MASWRNHYFLSQKPQNNLKTLIPSLNDEYNQSILSTPGGKGKGKKYDHNL